MHKVRRPRDIVDRKVLIGRLEAVLAEDVPKYKRRGRVLEVFKAALADGRAEVRRRFEERNLGTETVRENCFLIDQLVRTIYDFAVTHVLDRGVRTTGELLSVVAVGGYGRGELSPHSDIDLLFLLPYKKTPIPSRWSSTSSTCCGTWG